MNLLLFSAWVVAAVSQGISTSPDPLLERALQKIESSEDYVGALADLEKSLQGSRPDPMAHYQVGVCQTILRNYSTALDSFKRARELGIRGWELELGFGIAHFHLAQDTKAREHFDKTLSLKSDEVNALFHLGRLDVNGGVLDQALERFRQVLKIQPNHQGALFSLGSTLLQQGKEREGKRVLEHHRRMGHIQGRLKSLHLMADSPMASSEVFADLGDVYLDLGERAYALEAYEKAEHLSPGTALTSLGKGKLAYERGDKENAKTHLSRYLEKVSGDCQGYLLLGLIEKQDKKFGSARQLLKLGLELCPDQVLMMASLAEVELEQGNVNVAEEFAEKIIRTDPYSPAGPFYLAFCRIYQNRLEDAEKLGLQTLEMDQENPNHHTLMKVIYQTAGETEKAKLYEDKAQKLQSGFGPRP